VINYLTLPVVYGEDFYAKITSDDLKRYSKVAYLKNIMIGGIACQEKVFEGQAAVYISTINILKAYRRYKVGSQLLRAAIKGCLVKKKARIMYLNMHTSNEGALAFYEANGFKREAVIEGYYYGLEPPDCYVLVRRFSKREILDAHKF